MFYRTQIPHSQDTCVWFLEHPMFVIEASVVIDWTQLHFLEKKKKKLGHDLTRGFNHIISCQEIMYLIWFNKYSFQNKTEKNQEIKLV